MILIVAWGLMGVVGGATFCRNEYCYDYIPRFYRKYKYAHRICQRKNMELLTIDGPAEMRTVLDFVKRHRFKALGVWLGYDDAAVEGTFADRNGREMNYSNWYKNEPSGRNKFENCAGMDTLNGKWFDYICFARLPFVCKFRNPNYTLGNSSSGFNTTTTVNTTARTTVNTTARTTAKMDLGVGAGEIQMTSPYEQYIQAYGTDGKCTTCAITRGDFFAQMNYTLKSPADISNVGILSGMTDLERPRFFDVFVVNSTTKLHCGKVGSRQLWPQTSYTFQCSERVRSARKIALESYQWKAPLSLCEISFK